MHTEQSEAEIQKSEEEEVFDRWKNTRKEVRVTVRNLHVRFINKLDRTIVRVYSDSEGELVSIELPK